jgi:hypothetical protein
MAAQRLEIGDDIGPFRVGHARLRKGGQSAEPLENLTSDEEGR